METKLSSLQEKVALAIAAGATVTAAAEEAGISRVTVYRWMQTVTEFAPAVERNRSEFILARRDDFHHLASRAMETLLAILDNPRSSPAVLLKTAIFILQRDQKPAKNWSLTERLPTPESIPADLASQELADNVTECNGSQPGKRDDASQPEQNTAAYIPDYIPCSVVSPKVVADSRMFQELGKIGRQIRLSPEAHNGFEATTEEKAA